MSALLDIDIILDIEEYPEDYQSKDMLVTYSKQHKDVWERLSKEQFGGKYSTYKFDFLPRGSKEFIDTIVPKIKELFGITEADIVQSNIEKILFVPHTIPKNEI